MVSIKLRLVRSLSPSLSLPPSLPLPTVEAFHSKHLPCVLQVSFCILVDTRLGMCRLLNLDFCNPSFRTHFTSSGPVGTGNILECNVLGGQRA